VVPSVVPFHAIEDDLQAVIDGWPTLDEATKCRIIALVKRERIEHGIPH